MLFQYFHLMIVTDFVPTFERFLVRARYGDLQPEDYVSEVASTVAEAKRLVETGFEYVWKINEEQLFRKVK